MSGQESSAPVEGPELRRAIRNVYVAQATGTLYQMAFIRGGMLALFALSLGMPDWQIGLLAGSPRYLSFLRFVGLPLVHRYGNRNVYLAGMGLGALVMGSMLFVPLVGSRDGRILALFLVVVLSSMLTETGGTAWWPLLRGFIPPELTGRFFGRMRAVWQCTAMVAMGSAALWLGRNPAAWRYQVVIGVCFAGLVVRLFVVARLPDAHPVEGHAASLRQLILSALRDPRVRRLNIFAMVSSLSLGVYDAYVPVFLKESMGYSERAAVSVMTLVSGLGVVAYLVAGELVYRWGSRKTMRVSLMVTICAWLMLASARSCGPAALAILTVTAAVWGFSWSALSVSTTQAVFALSPRRGGHAILTLFMVFYSVSLGVGPALAGGLIAAVSGLDAHLGPWRVGPYECCFATAAVVALIALGLTGRLEAGHSEEPAAMPAA